MTKFCRNPRTASLLAFCASIGASTALSAQLPARPVEKHFPWSDTRLSPDTRADLVIKELTLDDKIQMLHGLGWQAVFVPPTSGVGTRAISAGGFIPGFPLLGIPDLQMTDSVEGPSGAGGQGRYATALPSAEAMAAAWDPALSYEIGTLIGEEVRSLGYNMSLGSGINLIREPRDGRTFEYKGEDPLLAGTLAGQELKAEKALHLITDVKHYVVNDQDDGRTNVNSVITKRAMRESDQLAFEIALKISGAGAVMCSYNMINGTYACENKYTLTDVLKNDFGFKGFVISDWGATESTVKAAMAGLDIEMPGSESFGAPLKTAVEKGDVPLARLDDMVHRILRTEFDAGVVDDPPHPQAPNAMRGLEVAQKVEEKAIVLLQNANNQLPLSAGEITSIAVIGGHADAGVLSGGGSSQVSPAGGNAVPLPPAFADDPMNSSSVAIYHRSSPLESIRNKLPSVSVRFDEGTNLAAAVALAKASQIAIVFATRHESEGIDLKDLSLPDDQDALIEAIAAVNPHTIVVLETGSAVLMPWQHGVAAILESWYPGIGGGQAITNVLFGAINPSGRLPITFPKNEADLPHPVHTLPPAVDAAHPMPHLPGYPGTVAAFMKVGPKFDVVYDEGLEVGYKWYDAEHKEPLFPFGYGLSYTTYVYSDLHVVSSNGLQVTMRVKNGGLRAGEETAQVYLTLPVDTHEPPKRLIGWSKVALRPGEEKEVTVNVDPLLLSIFDTEKNAWTIASGHYSVNAGSSSRDLPLSADIILGPR